MLSPSELRRRAEVLRGETAIDPAEAWSSEDVRESLAIVRTLLAVMFDQVAELREWRDYFCNLSTLSKKHGDGNGEPQPRTLKASEITVNGWYACRVKGGKWSDILVRVDDKKLANTLWSPPICEFYGPIELPE